MVSERDAADTTHCHMTLRLPRIGHFYVVQLNAEFGWSQALALKSIPNIQIQIDAKFT